MNKSNSLSYDGRERDERKGDAREESESDVDAHLVAELAHEERHGWRGDEVRDEVGELEECRLDLGETEDVEEVPAEDE